MRRRVNICFIPTIHTQFTSFSAEKLASYKVITLDFCSITLKYSLYVDQGSSKTNKYINIAIPKEVIRD